MKVSNEELLQIVGSLFIENWALEKRNQMQQQAMQQHMLDEHSPKPDKEEAVDD